MSADGTPSGWQVKPPTFASMRDDKLPDDVFNVLAMVWAALNWTAKRWVVRRMCGRRPRLCRRWCGPSVPRPAVWTRCRATKAAVVAADAWRVIG